MSSLLDYASYAVLGIFLAASAIAIFFRSGGSKAQEEAPAAAAPETKMAAKPAIVKKDFTAAELAPFTGEGGQPIYVGVDGYVFNMSSHEGGPAFYGPGGGYHAFAGKDATIGLATMQIDPAHWVKKTVSELSAAEKETLQDWVRRFQMKYDLIGYVTDGARPRSIKTEAQ